MLLLKVIQSISALILISGSVVLTLSGGSSESSSITDSKPNTTIKDNTTSNSGNNIKDDKTDNQTVPTVPDDKNEKWN